MIEFFFIIYFISGSSIPVGIAIGRQRQPGTHPGTSMPPSWPPLTSPTGCVPGSSTAASSRLAPTPGAPPSATPLAGPSPGGMGGHNPWMSTHHIPSPAGPIPMGYQLAKDPLTNQILLIPTDPNQPPSSNPLWPQPPGPHQAPTPAPTPSPHLAPPPHSPYGFDRIPPGVLQSHYQQLYLQQQHLR